MIFRVPNAHSRETENPHMSKKNGKKKDRKPTFYVQDPTGVSPSILLDPNDKYWQPSDHPTKKRGFEYEGGTIAGVDFPKGFYREQMDELVVCTEDGTPIDDDVVNTPETSFGLLGGSDTVAAVDDTPADAAPSADVASSDDVSVGAASSDTGSSDSGSTSD